MDMIFATVAIALGALIIWGAWTNSETRTSCQLRGGVVYEGHCVRMEPVE